MRLLAIATAALLIAAVAHAQPSPSTIMSLNFEDIRATSIKVGFTFMQGARQYHVAAKEWINNKFEQTVATSQKYVSEHVRNARLNGLSSGREYLIQVQALNRFGKPIGSVAEKVVRTLLRCYECDGKPSNRACNRAAPKNCPVGTDACLNEMRYQNGRLTITKRCAQYRPALAKQIRGGKDVTKACRGVHAKDAVCKCMCKSDVCNAADLPCSDRCSPPLRRPKGGTLICSNSNRVNSVCHWGCPDETIMVGLSKTTCLTDRTWSVLTPPVCRPIRTHDGEYVNGEFKEYICPELDHPTNGRITCTYNRTKDSVCTSSCKAGYTPTHPNLVKRRCLGDGRWTGRETVCKVISCPAPPISLRLVMDCEDYNVGTVCEISCPENLSLTGVNRVECGRSGTWSPSLPTCAKRGCQARPITGKNVIAECRDVTVPEEGAICEYSCLPGNTMRGAASSTCKRNKWSNASPICQPIRCLPAVSQPTFGRVTCTRSNRYKSECTFTCSSNYVLIGQESITCQASGEWSAAAPTCGRISCPPISEFEHGSYTCNRGRDVLSLCAFRCQTGYGLAEGSVSRIVCKSPEELDPSREFLGVWTSEAPTCEAIRCGPLELDENVARVCTKSDYRELGSICRFKCGTGHQIQGRSVSVCLRGSSGRSLGRWSSVPPKCVRRQCRPLTAYPNAEISCTDERYAGSVCTAECDRGYQATGNQNITCNNDGRWSSSLSPCRVVVCKAPPRPTTEHYVYECGQELRDPRFNRFLVDFVCPLSCSAGFTISGGNATKCGEEGEWITEQEVVCQDTNECDVENGGCDQECLNVYGSYSCSCDKNHRLMPDGHTCKLIVCPELPEDPQRTLVCTNGRSIGSTCLITCHQGYEPRDGASELTCGEDGTWNQDHATCQKVECANLRAPFNGEMICSDANRYESLCVSTCNEGYEMVGEGITSCTHAKTWTHRAPTCRKIQCPVEFTSLQNGRAICDDANFFQSQCSYFCNPGFKFVGIPATAFVLPTASCGSDGLWSSEAPSCEKVSCDPTVEVMETQRPHGDIECSEANLFESTCTITCPTGYQLIGSARTTCNEQRAWTQSLGHCEKIRCPLRESPQDGTMECTDANVYESTCTVTCAEGHDMIGESVSRCQADRTWSQRSPRCQRVTCDESRMAIGHGEVTCTEENFYNSRCSATCNLGYEFDTETVMEYIRKTRIARLMNATKGGAGDVIMSRCMATAQWDIGAPTCVKHSCIPSAQFLQSTRPNGEVTCTDGELFQSQCTLSCNSGYELTDGAETTECGNRRQWFEQLGVCSRVQCEAFSDFSNGQMTCDNLFLYESVCAFTCDAGYELIGESESVCQADRHFSNPQPVCQKIECPATHTQLENGKATCSDDAKFQSECVYVCDPGYEMTTSPDADTEDSDDVTVVTCQADRTWSGDLPYCKRKQCSMHDGALTEAKLNGDVECTESAWYGSQCSVTCHAGYRLIGPNSTRCTASADWAPTLGHCQKIECDELTAPENSQMSCSDGHRFQSTCTVTCDRGYERIGAAAVSCRADKTYNSELPTCNEILCPISFTTLDDGEATCSNANRFDSVCTYRCDPGYEMTPGSVARATCQVTYRWDAEDKPVCIKKRCPHASPVLLQALQHGTIDCTDEDRFESQCTLTCNEGYELTGGSGVTRCLANQNWEETFGHCQKITCPAFESLENGQITCSDENKYLSVCSFACDPGYELEGEENSTCQSDRTFSNDLPSCQKTTCQDSHLSIENGATTCTESNLYESVCEYVCEAGYEITAGGARAQCQDDRTWDEAKATCEKKMCPSNNDDFIQADRNGVITCTEGHVFESVCSLVCDAGYRLVDGGTGQTRCNEDAQWEPTLGYCIKIECEAFDPLSNGVMTCSDENRFLSSCQFQCDAGYEMEGSSSSVCQANKTWDAPMPACYKISCPRSFLQLNNGEAQCTESNRFESVCSYACDEGYEMATTDYNSTLCTESETWSRPKPTCSKKRCPRNDASLLKAGEIGLVNCSDENLYQSVCTVTCPEGYELIGGVESVTCQSTANWDASMGFCQKIRCSALVRPANGDISCTDENRFESVCEFECHDGYYMTGTASSRCQANGNFSNPEPTCNKISCAMDHTSMEFGNVQCSEENLFESVCAYQCQTGYRFINNDVIADEVMTSTCLADASWTEEIPICEKVTCDYADENFVHAHETGDVSCTEGNRFGSTCKITCAEGQDVIGHPATTCTDGGQWNVSLGHCKMVECDTLTSPFFGNLSCSNGFMYSSQCNFSCQEGYEFTSESWDMVLVSRQDLEDTNLISAECNVDGSWTVTGSLECEKKVCPLDGFGALDNGQITCSDRNYYMSQCLWQCDPGYEAARPRDRADVTSVLVTCNSDAQWSEPQPPRCRRMECETNVTQLQNMNPHGRVTCTNGAMYGSECTLKCNKGYHLTSDYNSTTCGLNREWSAVLPTCQKNQCEALSDPPHGMLTCTDDNFFKSHCYLQCEPGYHIVDPEEEYDVTGGITCRSDGTWCGDVPKCEKVTCPKEQTRLVNGDVVCSDFNFYQSHCAYSCDLGYHMISGQSSMAECTASGEWSELPPVCETNRCPANETSILEAQERGEVTCSNENHFGSRCALKCYDGYQLTGEPSTVCLHSMEWSNGLGLCQRISCPNLATSAHSTLDCTNQFRYQSTCVTTCDPGYERVTSSDVSNPPAYDAICEANGRWTGTVPECQKKICPWNGYSSIAHGHVQCSESNMYGSTCVYICEPGYEMRSSVGMDTTVSMVNCTVHGNWSIAPPVCMPSQCSPTVRQMKESVANGNVSCTNGSAFGSKCSIECECGYQKTTDGSVETVCQRNGKWWPPMANCQRITCPTPEVPAHTRVECTNEYLFDSSCSSASCDDGYMLTPEDDAIITCAGAGHWLGQLPACKKRECDASFLTLEHGSMVCSDANNYASTCEYSCERGYVLVADRQVAQCLASGEWSVEAVVCTRRTSCESTYFAFGSVECGPDGRCQLSCDVGTDLIGPGESTCRDDESGVVQWEPELGLCKKRSCENLAAPESGSVTCSDRALYRSMCRFRCDEGFRLVGERNVRCRSDGRWSEETPRCVERTCSASYLTIENGIVSASSSVRNGSVARFACSEGYELIGSPEVTCLSSGVWNREKPSCLRLTCSPLRLENGEVECSHDATEEQGVTCSFRCNSMYQLTGASSATCRPDGTWSNPTPYCKGFCDSSFTQFNSGRINCSNSNYHRSQCRFWCDSASDVTMQLHGSPVITCQEDGRWSGVPPCCARECPGRAKIDVYFVLDSSAAVGFKNWTKVLDFVNSFLSTLSVGEQDAQVGVVRYNREIDVMSEITLGKIEDRDELQHAVSYMPYGGWGTNTGEALSYVAENSFASPSNRPDARDYVILVTDGVSDDDVSGAAQKLASNGITTYAIGIGGVDQEQLREIASAPEFVHTVEENFEGLDESLVGNITSSLCENPCLMQNSWRNLSNLYLSTSEG